MIVVDWGHGAGLPYGQATANTRVVGAETAVLVQAMISAGANASMMHLIGHSLGAHIAGYAGERVPHIGRITGKLQLRLRTTKYIHFCNILENECLI